MILHYIFTNNNFIIFIVPTSAQFNVWSHRLIISSFSSDDGCQGKCGQAAVCESHVCVCQPGYSGNGYSCYGKLSTKSAWQEK